jgi:hypothetical protein
MDNKLAGALILTAFASGYGLCLYQAPLELPAITVINNTQASSSTPEETFADVEFPDASVNITNPIASSSAQASSAGSSPSHHPAASQTASTSSTSPAASTTDTGADPLSEEEIDQLIPKPFSTSFKKAHPDLKAKYKDFVDPNKRPDDWDIRMQGLLRDFIMSRPTAADINIESLICNASMCEVRLLENKKFLLLGLFGELMQQPWIANQVKGTVDFNPDNSNACYILLMRNPSAGQ